MNQKVGSMRWCVSIPRRKYFEIVLAILCYLRYPFLVSIYSLTLPERLTSWRRMKKEGKEGTHCGCQAPSAKRTGKWVSQAMARWSTFSWEQKMNNQIASASAKRIQLCLMGQEGDKCLACPRQQTGVPGLMRVWRKAAFQMRASFSGQQQLASPHL